MISADGIDRFFLYNAPEVKLSQVIHMREAGTYDQFQGVIGSLVISSNENVARRNIADSEIEIMHLKLHGLKDVTPVSVWIDSWWAFILAAAQNFSASQMAESGETMFHEQTFPLMELHISLKDNYETQFSMLSIHTVALLTLLAPKEVVLTMADHFFAGVKAAENGEDFQEYVPHIIAECYGEKENTFGYFSRFSVLNRFIEDCMCNDPEARIVVQASRGEDPVIVEIDGDNKDNCMQTLEAAIS